MGEPPPLRRRRIFENFFKNSWRKLQKCSIFAHFAKEFPNYAVNFRAFGRKTQLFGKFWENFETFLWKFNGKLNFFYFLGKFVAKNRNLGNNIIFLQHFFRFGGGWTPLTPPPAYATVCGIFGCELDGQPENCQENLLLLWWIDIILIIFMWGSFPAPPTNIENNPRNEKAKVMSPDVQMWTLNWITENIPITVPSDANITYVHFWECWLHYVSLPR